MADKLTSIIWGTREVSWSFAEHKAYGGLPAKLAGADIATPRNTTIKGGWVGTVYAMKTGAGEQNYVTLKHNGFFSEYGHLKNIRVKKGQAVEAGQILGETGVKNKRGEFLHLHFAIIMGNRYAHANRIDPIPFMFPPTPSPAPTPAGEFYTVKQGKWRSNVIQEIINAGIWTGTWKQNQPLFDSMNPITPRGGWKPGDRVRIKKAAPPPPPPPQPTPPPPPPPPDPCAKERKKIETLTSQLEVWNDKLKPFEKMFTSVAPRLQKKGFIVRNASDLEVSIKELLTLNDKLTPLAEKVPGLIERNETLKKGLVKNTGWDLLFEVIIGKIKRLVIKTEEGVK